MIRATILKFSAALTALLLCATLTLAQSAPQTPPGQPVMKVADRELKGTENVSGQDTALTFQFASGDEVVMIDAWSDVHGSYEQNGTSVQITFANCVYEGTINGNVLSGTARFTEGDNAGHTWNFSVQLKGQ